MDIETLLCAEISRELSDLKGLEVGTDEHKAVANVIAQLTDRVIELEKISIDETEKIKAREQDFDLKRTQMEDDRKNRLITNCIAVAGIVVPSVITIWGTLRSFEFEKEGTITTIMGRGFVNKLLPKK